MGGHHSQPRFVIAQRGGAAAIGLLLVVAPAAGQTGRIALDTVIAADGVAGSTVRREPGVWFDVFGVLRLAEGLDLVARPQISRRTFNGTWQKQIYQLGVRYERPGSMGLRLEAGQMPSPIGLGLVENRPDLNPVISQHSAYYLSLPRIDPEIPRAFLIAAAYPLGAQVTLAGSKWDARGAVLDSSPVRGRPFFGSNKPPRMLNWVGGFGVTPHIGLRLGAAFARGPYASVREVRDVSRGDRDATMIQVEGEWSFGYTRLAGEWVWTIFETARADAKAIGGWVEITQTLTPGSSSPDARIHRHFRRNVRARISSDSDTSVMRRFLDFE